MKLYEITVEMPDILGVGADWRWTRTHADDFHAACVFGLDHATNLRGRLLRVEAMNPPNQP